MPTLHFKGKTFVQNHHLAVPYCQLVPDKKKSLTDKVSLHDNLIIHGDNLKALKALLPLYAGKVKCIYIDPPYNTGNENWVYNDNVNSPMMKEWLGKVVDKEDLTRHDKWLCMLMPRLKLLKELLAEDGVIFISIDDCEQHRLRMLLDEVFGEDNFLVEFVWKSRQFTDARSTTHISNDHEYVFAYSKSSKTSFRGVARDESKFNNPDNDKRGPWMSRSILGLASKKDRPNLHYSFKDPKTGHSYAPPENTGWRYSKEKIHELISDKRIIFPKTAEGRPREKKFRSDIIDEFSSFPSVISDIYTSDGTKEIREIFGTDIIAFPKPSVLIKNFINQSTDDDSIILDSFSGSGTTAHAVLSLNKEDGGNRKFILVECEDYADKITAERVRRIIKGVKNAKDDNIKEGLGGSFSYFALGDTIEMEGILRGKKLPSYEELARYVFYTATGEEFDPTKIDEKKNYIGSSKDYDVYLFYKPDIEYLKSTALNLDRADSLGPLKTKKRLVFAPTKYLDTETMLEKRIEFCQLPFEIYRLKG